ncbi:MAG: hypothetical protein EOM26_03490 [Alphaproteobacteria bacterium]|nr:hypothetical protein [Alphaproteobacteria bacterium]
MTKQILRSMLVACLLAVTAHGSAAAQDAQHGLFGLLAPAATSGDISALETHPPLRLTPDKSELVRLNADAASIIVGNPAHANVLLDSTRLLVVVPRTPGATHFTVLDAQGQVIMQRHVIVASPKERYIRLRRTCSMGGENCAQTSVYYCPDMCHEIALTEGAGEAQTADSDGGEAEDGQNEEAE